MPIDPISIAQQISRCRIERKGFEHLLGGPFSRRMRRDVEVDNPASIVSENDKNKQNFKPNRVDGKEVDGSELRNMIIEERPPRLRRLLRTSDHVFCHRSFGNLNA